MNLLIIGSEGFIGSHLVNFFRNKQFTVTSADIVLKNEPGYILINPELPSFSNLFQHNKYDVCINASGAANVQFSFTYPHADYTLNAANVYSILEAIRQYNAGCRFINLSSAAVYGNPKQLPVNELAEIMPTSPYGFHKYYSEQVCREFSFLFGIKTISLRIFSAYGPGLKKQLFWDLYQKAKQSKGSFPVFGSGKETRDFIYIDDLTEAVHCVIKQDYFNGGHVNIASGVAVTIKEVVLEFIKNFDTGLAPDFSDQAKQGDPLYWQADITLLKSFGFINKYSIQQGIKETVDWLKKQE